MAMTLRLGDEDDEAVARAAAREGTSKHEVIVRAVRAYTGDRQLRLERSVARVLERDREVLERLAE